MSHSPNTGFMVLHSNQLEGLRDLMVEFIRNHPLAPLQPEVLLVQSNGMKHWLELTLAKELGICAATQIDLPSTALWQIYRQVLGADAVPAHMPLDKSPLTWRLMRRLPALLEQSEFAPLHRYVQGEQGQPQTRRLFQLAQQVADVFDGYQNYRADWLTQWAQNQDDVLPPEQRWQAVLWRDVLADLAQDPQASAFRSRSEVHDAFVQQLAQCLPEQRPQGVPERLMVFGVTSLPMQTVQALAALGQVCQVLLWVQNPCQHHWGHVVESHRPLAALAKRRQHLKAGLPAPAEHLGLDEQFLLHTQTNPLLAAWGKHGRDYLHLLDAFDDVNRYRAQFNRVDAFIDPAHDAQEAGRAPTRLEWLQSDVLQLEPPPATPREHAAQDLSIELLQAHSAQREVEVLHDHILHWLEGDASLKPSDIMVMVPDMSRFAPHIHAVFGRKDSRVAYSVADTTPRTEPLVQALDSLLQLPQLRLTRLEWLSWFEVAEMRQRFGLDEAGVQLINTWLQDAGVRWGLDAQHRSQWGMAAEIDHANQNTWLFGVERLLLGYASGLADEVWGDTAASLGVGGLHTRLVEGLLQWLRQVQTQTRLLQQEHTPAQWVALLQQLMAQFFKAQTDAQERLLERVMAPLERWLEECQLARMDAPLPLAVVREHWLNQLQQPAMHQRFFGGGVQFATLMPMRSIPFKVVCLLGMNDADYPRQQSPIDFDLMRDPTLWRAGDRSRREDDRYLFLEAVLSAREKLYISWQGKRTHDHQELPPSVLVAQLMDYLNLAWRTPTVAPIQPLQAFSKQYFQAPSQFFTYASEWQSAYASPATSDNSRQNLSLVSAVHKPLNPRIELSQLSRLLRQPVSVYLNDHLNVRLTSPQADVQESEPFALEPLQRYQLTHAVATSEQPEHMLSLLRMSGQLALAGLGEQQTQALRQHSDTLRERMAHWLQPDQQALPLQSIELPMHIDGDTFTLCAQWPQSQQIWRMSADGQSCLQLDVRAGSVVQGKDDAPQPRGNTLCDVWLYHLVACAAGLSTTSVQLGLKGELRFEPMPAQAAQHELTQLVGLYQQAWLRALPVARDSACAWWVATVYNAKNPEQEAQQCFEGNRQRTGELQKHAVLQRVFTRFDDLRAEQPVWAEALYGQMIRSVQVVSHESEAP